MTLYEGALFLLKMEILRFVRGLHSGLAFLLLFCGILGVAWVAFVASPLDIISAVTFLLLWKCYERMLNMDRNEFQALSLFSLSWREVIWLKNVAVIFLTVVVYASVSILLLHFSPRTMAPTAVAQSALIFLSILFPLVSMGNVRSQRNRLEVQTALWRNPEGIVNVFAAVFLLAIPGKLILAWERTGILISVYVGLWIIYWHVTSIPKAASLLEEGEWK